MSTLTIKRRRSKTEGRSGNENQNAQLNVLDADATGRTRDADGDFDDSPPSVSSEPADKKAARAFMERMKAREAARKARRGGK